MNRPFPVRATPLIVLAALCLASCAKKDEAPRTPAAEAIEGAPATPAPVPDASQLAPVIRALGSEDRVPAKIVIELARPLVDRWRAGQAPDEGTRFSLTPDAPGGLAWTGPSTLTFTPTDGFLPGTKYEARLEAIAVGDDVLRAENGGWRHVFTTPSFRLVRIQLASFDAKAKDATVRLDFSAPVDAAEVRKRLSARLARDGGPVVAVKDVASGDAPDTVTARIVHPALAGGVGVTLALAEGVPLLARAKAKAPEAKFTVEMDEWHASPVMTIRAVAPAEGTGGYFIEVVCDDRGAGGQRGHWDSASSTYHEDLSTTCQVDEDSAAEHVKLDPPLDFTVAAGAAGFRIFAAFQRGPQVVRFERGLETVDGGVLRATGEHAISIPARTPRVAFVTKGRYVPRSAWRALPVQHLNVDGADLTVRHVPAANLVAWMAEESEAADERNSNLLVRTRIPLRSPPDEPVTTPLDAAALVAGQVRGLVEVRLAAGEAGDAARLVLTDLQLVAKLTGGNRESPWGAEVLAWALDAETLSPASGVTVELVRRSGQVLASGTTRTDGGVVLPIPAADVDPSPPFALVARRAGDLTYLAFDEVQDRVAEERVAGESFAGTQPYRATLITDRGVYRPGETAHLTAVVRGRDFVAPPAGLPLRLRVVDPRGQVLREAPLATSVTGLAALDVEFPQFAATGRHEIQLDVAERRVATSSFHVEEFVPERMRVEARPRDKEILVGGTAGVDVSARYLFGGVPANHRVELTCTLEAGTFEPRTNAAFHYGTWRPDDRLPPKRSLGTVMGVLDAEGAASLDCPSAAAGSLDGPARLVASAAVLEGGSGRATVGQASLPVHPDRHYVGLASRTSLAKAGEPILVDGVVVDWEGRLVTSVAEVELELLRLEPEHGWTYDEETGTTSRGRTWRRLREGTTTAKVAQGRFAARFTPAEDAETFVVRATAGRARTEMTVPGQAWSWWWGDGSGNDRTPEPSRPAWIALDAPPSARVGQPVTVSFTAPHAGRVLLAAETDRVVASEWKEVAAGRVTWSFTLREFSPNVYVTALLLKPPHLESRDAYLPDRAFGVANVMVEPAAFRASVALTVPDEVRSGTPLPIDLTVPPGEGPFEATIAAVDEGILSLTKFASPDPLSGIFTRRALGVETFETVGWTLLVPPSGPSGRPGGDQALALGRIQAVKPVALWSGVLAVPSSGRLRVTLPVPQYRGTLRVMAVVVGAKTAGSASAQVAVRDPLTLDVTLPRFLLHGDHAEVPVFVTNLSGAARNVTLELRSEALDIGGAAVTGPRAPVAVLGAPKSLALADGEGGVAVFRVRATEAAGAARLTALATSGKLQSVHEAEVPILPSAPRTREIQRFEVETGTVALAPRLSGWVPLTERTSVRVTSNPHGDALDHLAWLIRYPYGCIEQVTSTTRPLLVIQRLVSDVDPKLVAAGGGEALAKAGLDRILSMQLASGAFSYWPGGREPAYWGTAHATQVLLEAKARNYPVAQDRIDQALAWMEDRVTNWYEKGLAATDDESRDAEPYMHYVLAVSGRPRKARVEALIQQEEPRAGGDGFSAEKLTLLRAALWLAGDRRHEGALRAGDVTPVASTRRNDWTFYSDRRRRGLLLSTQVDLFGREGASPKLAELVAESLRGRHGAYTTQEVAWCVVGLGKLAEAGATFDPPTLTADGRVAPPAPRGPGQAGSERTWDVPRAGEHGSLELDVKKTGEGKLWVVLASEGVRQGAAWRFGGEGLSVRREFVAADGSPLDLSAGVALGDVLHVVLSVTNQGPERMANAALVDRVPAGWEIENPRLGRGTAVEWLDEKDLWDADHVDVRDDRLEVFGHLDAGATRKVAYAVRAVTAGRFTIPPVEAEAMYDPSRWARAPGRVVEISGPWLPVAQ